MSKKRILIISTVGLIYDGITSVITSYLEAMDLTSFDIRIAGTIKIEPSIRAKIEEKECKVVLFPDRRKETIKYFFALLSYIKKENIEVIHAHGNSGTLAVELLAAYLGGARKRIVHSHNTKCDQKTADKLLRPLFNVLYTDALACGQDAGRWLYGSRPFTVLVNGRKIDKYIFDSQVRERMRSSYGIKDEIVVGHVGGFFLQKNHRFLLEVFREILRKRQDVKLCLVGDGPLKNEIEESVEDIKDHIIFAGVTDRVEDFLQMMDVMVFPSFFEGLPLVVLEWQINGMRCFVSDTVTRECQLTESVTFLSLEESAEKWAEAVICDYSIEERKKRSISAAKKMEDSKYNIEHSVRSLEKLYED